MRRELTLLSLLAAAACGGGSSTGGTTPPPAPVATVTVSPTAGALVPGATLQLTAVTKDGSGNTLTDRTVTWTTSSSAIATVTTGGLVSAAAPGTATITATAEGKSAAATITITPGAVIGATGGTVTSADANATVVIPAGALTQGTSISIAPATGTPAFAYLIDGTAYEFQPTGTQFAQPVTISIKYNPTKSFAGIPQSATQMRVVSNGAWTPLDSSSVDTVAHVVSAKVSHFTPFGTVSGPIWFGYGDYSAGDGGATLVAMNNVTVCVGGTTSAVAQSPAPDLLLPTPTVSFDPAAVTATVAADRTTVAITGLKAGVSYIKVSWGISYARIEVTINNCPASVPLLASLHDGVALSDNISYYNSLRALQAVSSAGQARYAGLGQTSTGSWLLGFRYAGGAQPVEQVYWNGPAGQPTTIALPSNGAPIGAGRFTANGNFVFPAPVGLTSNLWGVPFGGTTAQQLTNFPGYITDLEVVPGGSMYLTYRGTTGSNHIYTIPAPSFTGNPMTTGMVQVTNGSLIEGVPSVSQNGRLLAYEQYDGSFTKSQIMIQSTSAPFAPSTAISPATGYAFIPAWCGNEYLYYLYSSSFNGPYRLMQWNAAINASLMVGSFSTLSFNDFSIARLDGDHGVHVCP